MVEDRGGGSSGVLLEEHGWLNQKEGGMQGSGAGTSGGLISSAGNRETSPCYGCVQGFLFCIFTYFLLFNKLLIATLRPLGGGRDLGGFSDFPWTSRFFQRRKEAIFVVPRSNLDRLRLMALQKVAILWRQSLDSSPAMRNLRTPWTTPKRFHRRLPLLCYSKAFEKPGLGQKGVSQWFLNRWCELDMRGQGLKWESAARIGAAMIGTDRTPGGNASRKIANGYPEKVISKTHHDSPEPTLPRGGGSVGLAGMPPVLLALLLAVWSPEAKAQVVAGLADTDAQVAAGGAAASTISLRFTTTNHNTVQTVTVTGVDDNMDNLGGGREVTHQPSSTSLMGQGGVSETDNLGDFNTNAQAQTTINICDRTPQIKAKILSILSKTEADCGSIRPEDLAKIALIRINENQSLTALKASDFDGLTRETLENPDSSQ